MRSLPRFFSESLLLFWTILLVSSQHHAVHFSLHDQIVLVHRSLLAPLSHAAPRSIYDVHAILLLCIWPLAPRKEASNPAWSYVGLAINACVEMGLHKPAPTTTTDVGPQQRISQMAAATAGWNDQRREVSVFRQRLTWLACFSISTQYVVTPSFPFPPEFSPAKATTKDTRSMKPI